MKRLVWGALLMQSLKKTLQEEGLFFLSFVILVEVICKTVHCRSLDLDSLFVRFDGKTTASI